VKPSRLVLTLEEERVGASSGLGVPLLARHVRAGVPAVAGLQEERLPARLDETARDLEIPVRTCCVEARESFT
jgi:hypothetical protein